jgi:hypothetical protein
MSKITEKLVILQRKKQFTKKEAIYKERSNLQRKKQFTKKEAIYKE